MRLFNVTLGAVKRPVFVLELELPPPELLGLIAATSKDRASAEAEIVAGVVCADVCARGRRDDARIPRSNRNGDHLRHGGAVIAKASCCQIGMACQTQPS